MVLLSDIAVLNPTAVEFAAVEVLADNPDCIAVRGFINATGASVEGGIGSEKDFVIEYQPADWGLSWVGEGWRCDGPHPFSD